jgi:uncharacterized protein YjbJ (UPF0337 family)
MADISDKAEELGGTAKQAAGDLTGNGELRAEGTVGKASAQVKQGLDTAAEKSREVVDAVAETTSDGAKAAAAKAEEVKDAVADKVDDASRQLSALADNAGDAAKGLRLDDPRVAIAAVGGIAVLLVLVIRRKRSKPRRTARKVAKRATLTGIGHALSN